MNIRSQVDSRYADSSDGLYAQVTKRPKTKSADVGEMPRRKRRQKKSVGTESEVNGTMTGTEDSYSDGWVDVKVQPSEPMQTTEANGQSPDPPIHTPLHLGMLSGRSRVLWDPYEAGDVSAKILTTEEQVTPSQVTHSKPKRKHSIDSINSQSVRKSPDTTVELPLATVRTLNALRDAGLLPSEDYTSVVLDTRTFGPRPRSKTQETSLDGRRDLNSRNPYMIPGQPRPVWSMEDEPELENDVEVTGHAKVHGSKTSLKYSDDDIDESGRSDDSGVMGSQSGRRRRGKRNRFIKIDSVEQSSNA